MLSMKLAWNSLASPGATVKASPPTYLTWSCLLWILLPQIFANFFLIVQCCLMLSEQHKTMTQQQFTIIPLWYHVPGCILSTREGWLSLEDGTSANVHTALLPLPNLLTKWEWRRHLMLYTCRHTDLAQNDAPAWARISVGRMLLSLT